MEAQVAFNTLTKLFDLIIEINSLKEIISTSKNYGHWQYHFNRGTLAKSVAKYGITSFVYIGFTPTDPPPTNELRPTESIPINVESNWFETQSLIESEVKKRGRPRKYLPRMIGVTVHKFSDEESAAFKMITLVDKEVIERNFKMFIKSMDLKESLEELALKFQIPYKQAFDIVNHLI